MEIISAKIFDQRLSDDGYIDLSQFNQAAELKVSWLPQGLQIKARERLKSGYSIKGFFLCKDDIVPPQQSISTPTTSQYIPDSTTDSTINTNELDELHIKADNYRQEISDLKIALHRETKKVKELTNNQSSSATVSVIPVGTKTIRDEDGEDFLLLPRIYMETFTDSSKGRIKVISAMQSHLREKYGSATIPHKMFQEYDAALVEKGYKANPSESEKDNIEYNYLTRFDKFIRLVEKYNDPQSINSKYIVSFKTDLREIIELYSDMMATGTTEISLY